MKKNLYFVTSAELAENVLPAGVRCDMDGRIWLFEDKRVAGVINGKRVSVPMAQIVATYLDLDSFAVISVQPGGLDSISNAGTVATNPKRLEAFKYMWVAEQPTIAPEFLKIESFYTFNRNGKRSTDKRSLENHSSAEV